MGPCIMAQLSYPATLLSEGTVPLPTSDLTSLILIHFFTSTRSMWVLSC